VKVLDLQCAYGHTFEGWFASEDDFVAQRQQSQVLCPACGDPSVVKKLSAPRLLLSGGRSDTEASHKEPMDAVPSAGYNMTALWLTMARQVLAQTTDVGDKFAEEARKIHYGERPKRAIRGTATREETQMLFDEGIDVLPFALPAALKEPLQ
jgi:hypothetical protein